MHALANEFIEVEIKRLERILAGVRARQGEEVLDDMLQPLSFVAGEFAKTRGIPAPSVSPAPG